MYNISKQSGIEKKLKIVQEFVFKILVHVILIEQKFVI